LSQTTSVVAEQLVLDLGLPRDYYNRRCKCIFDFKQMCYDSF